MKEKQLVRSNDNDVVLLFYYNSSIVYSFIIPYSSWPYDEPTIEEVDCFRNTDLVQT